jgi:uncharacterized protein (TIGR03032 family)
MASPHLTTWLADQHLAIACTTYRSGRLLLFGLTSGGVLAVTERRFDRAVGLCAHERQLYLGTRFQLWRFDDALKPEQIWQDCDRLYVPQLSWMTGALHTHDIVASGSGRLLFVNTMFSCLALPSAGYSFCPVWQPPWVSALLPEDRCHLNGVALADDHPAFVTAASQSDTARGWRDQRREGGVVVRVSDGETILAGLSMPHSPRWHGGRLWILDSGRGLFGFLDPARGRFERVSFCPGFARGLAIHGDFAVIGLSKPRSAQSYSGLELDEVLSARRIRPRCGLIIVDLRTGERAHGLWIESAIDELYDVVVLPDVRRPAILGVESDEALHAIVPGPQAKP